MRVGETFTSVVAVDINRTHLVMYAAASGDFHPVHHDDLVAQAMGFPSVFAHGMLTMGLTGRHIEEVVGRGTLMRYSAQLVAQVWPGDTLTSTISVRSVEDGVAELTLRTANQDGVGVLRGDAAARLGDR
ncbi:MAG: putative dehydrogenase [Mycobacterium sp.]|jgi:acyl dehydratase|nr:putative dehydrogenase [Mycobacterium sp.]